MEDYWNNLIGDSTISKGALFLKIRNLYTEYLSRLYNDINDIPDFRIHFSLNALTREEGKVEGYEIVTITRTKNEFKRSTIHDFFEIENFSHSYTWYENDAFVIFDYRETSNSPLMFVTSSFFEQVMQQIKILGIRHLKISYMFAPMIASGISEFFYGYYALDVNLIQTLSAMTYEGTYIDCTFLVPRYDLHASRQAKRNDLDIELAKPVNFSVENLRQIRKIVEMSDQLLSVSVNAAGNIVGLTKGSAFPDECRIRMWGHLSYTFTYDEGKQISYYNARYHIDGTGNANSFIKMLQSLSFAIERVSYYKMWRVINEASKQEHGTILIIGSPETTRKEARRLIRMQRGTEILPLDLSQDIDLIHYLTRIDGAIIMDTNCQCICIGAILDGDAVEQGSLARGSRYNSTVNYIKRRNQLGERFVGIVISEDGTVDAVSPDDTVRLNLR